MNTPFKGDPELRRAFLLDGLDALAHLCANQMRGGEPPLSQVGSLIRILSEEARIVCLGQQLMAEPGSHSNDS